MGITGDGNDNGTPSKEKPPSPSSSTGSRRGSSSSSAASTKDTAMFSFFCRHRERASNKETRARRVSEESGEEKKAQKLSVQFASGAAASGGVEQMYDLDSTAGGSEGSASFYLGTGEQSLSHLSEMDSLSRDAVGREEGPSSSGHQRDVARACRCRRYLCCF